MPGSAYCARVYSNASQNSICVDSNYELRRKQMTEPRCVVCANISIILHSRGSMRFVRLSVTKSMLANPNSKICRHVCANKLYWKKLSSVSQRINAILPQTRKQELIVQSRLCALEHVLMCISLRTQNTGTIRAAFTLMMWPLYYNRHEPPITRTQLSVWCANYTHHAHNHTGSNTQQQPPLPLPKIYIQSHTKHVLRQL